MQGSLRSLTYRRGANFRRKMFSQGRTRFHGGLLLLTCVTALRVSVRYPDVTLIGVCRSTKLGLLVRGTLDLGGGIGASVFLRVDRLRCDVFADVVRHSRLFHVIFALSLAVVQSIEQWFPISVSGGRASFEYRFFFKSRDDRTREASGNCSIPVEVLTLFNITCT